MAENRKILNGPTWLVGMCKFLKIEYKATQECILELKSNEITQ